MGYVEEHDNNGEECGEDTENYEEPDLGDVWEGADTNLGRASS